MRNVALTKFLKTISKKNLIGNGVLLSRHHIFASSVDISIMISNDTTVTYYDNAVNYGIDLTGFKTKVCDSDLVDVLTAHKHHATRQTTDRPICKVNASKLFKKSYLASMGKDDVRYYLNSQFVKFRDSIETVVSDGYRLVTERHDIKCSELLDVIIPRDAVEILSALDHEVIISARYDNDTHQLDRIEFSGFGFNLYVVPINSKYPNFDNLLSKWCKNRLTTVIIDRKVALSEMKANKAKLISVAKCQGVTVTGDTDVLNFHDMVDHERKVLFSLKANGVNKSMIGKFEMKYLIDLMANETGKTVEINFYDDCLTVERGKYLNIVMARRD